MRCSQCGRQFPDTVSFCSVCGARIGVVTGAPVVSSSRGTRNNTPLLIMIVVVVVAVVVVGSIVAALAVNDMARQASQSHVRMTVQSVSYDPNYSYPPSSGMRFVQITVLFENIGEGVETISPSFFEVETSEGATYASVPWIDTSIPLSLAPGSSTTFSVAFEIPINTVPTMLNYAPILERTVSAPI